MAEARAMAVVVVWAEAGQASELALQLPSGSTLGEALAAASLQTGHIFAATQEAGIWGRLLPRHTVLAEGDRVELYEPLLVDPKKARRERFAQQGARRAGLFSRRRPQSKQGYGA